MLAHLDRAMAYKCLYRRSDYSYHYYICAHLNLADSYRFIRHLNLGSQVHSCHNPDIEHYVAFLHIV